jgi:hypothetical protein
VFDVRTKASYNALGDDITDISPRPR